MYAGGDPFRTDGCPDREGAVACNRPYGSYRPGEAFRDYPFAPEAADVEVSGSGEATVWASERLNAEVSGSGEIGYYGSPALNQETSGSGSVTGLGSR